MRGRPRRWWLAACGGASALVLTAGCALGSPSPSPVTADEAVALVLAQRSEFAGIAPLDPDLIGQAAWYQVAPTGGGWQVLVRIGWGDCEAGCISEHRWTYEVGADRSVELVAESGGDLPAASGLRVTVRSGPTCPVVQASPDPVCADQPVADAVMVVTTLAGDEVATLTSDANGSAGLDLAPGAYRLVPRPVQGLLGTPEPIEFLIDLGQPIVELTISYDTGIR